MTSYARALRKIAKQKREVEIPTLNEETLNAFVHNMQVEGQVLSEVYDDLKDLEKTDLFDYFKLEKSYGRTNKTR